MASYKIDYEKNRIDIVFDRKPSVEIRDSLKCKGWRWNSFDKCWYHYYSESHLQFAKDICDKKIEERPYQSTKTNTIPTVRNAPFGVGDSCKFSLDYDDKRVGVVIKVDLENEKAKIAHIVSICDGEVNYDSAWVSFSKIRQYKPISEDYIFAEGEFVSFVGEDGLLEKGIIIRDNCDSTYDIRFFSIRNDGRIEENTNYSVDNYRIVEIEYGVSIYPVKKGNKVEYESPDDGTVNAKVIHVSADGSVSLEYFCNIGGIIRIKKHDFNVTFDKIRLIIKEGKKALPRSSYISTEKQESIEKNENIKERIKNRLDSFTDATGIYQNRVLYRHQKAGTMLAEMYDKFAFFYDTGTGKTVMALDIIERKQQKDGAHFLIIAPKSIIKTAWLDDAAKFYPDLRILPLYKSFGIKKKRRLLYSWKTGLKATTWDKDRVFIAHIKLLTDVFELGELKVESDKVVEDALQDFAQHYIINSELFIREPTKYISEFNISGIIMDESAILKNYHGKTAEIMRMVAEKMRYVYLLSGKPAPNNVTEYFSQMKIVDPDTFSMSYESFLKSFCFGQRKEMIPANKKLFADMVSIRSLIISKKDCLDLPDTVDVVRQIELPKSIMQDYYQLYFECMTFIKGMDESLHFYSTHSKLAILMKLRQMASGFFITGSGRYQESEVIIDIHKAKIDELKAILDQIPEEQVIIWCQFQHEIELVAHELSRRAETVTAYGKTKDLEKSIDDFKNRRAQYIVAHPKTLKYGVTFVNCKYTIYYSFSYSAEDYDQSHDRNYRMGQTETCTYIYIQAADTIDEIMYEKVMYKLSSAEFFERLIKDASRHGIDYDSLKGKTDYEINMELSSDNGSLKALASEIISKENDSTQNEITDSDNRVFTTYDYLDKIAGPTENELLWLEEYFMKEDNPYLYIDDGPYSDRLFDTSRPDYFDFIHPEELYEKFDVNMALREYYIFLKGQPQEDWWIYDMYRAIDRALKRMPEDTADVMRKKYGLKNGRKQSNTAVAKLFRRRYGDIDEYTWNPARVAQVLRDGLAILREDESLLQYGERIKKMFFLE